MPLSLALPLIRRAVSSLLVPRPPLPQLPFRGRPEKYIPQRKNRHEGVTCLSCQRLSRASAATRVPSPGRCDSAASRDSAPSWRHKCLRSGIQVSGDRRVAGSLQLLLRSAEVHAEWDTRGGAVRCVVP